VLLVPAADAPGQCATRDDDIEWDVLADPEGNEFCVFEPAAPAT
jgi:hypothetical protein